MDVHYHLICEYVEDGMVKIQFLNSNENDVGLFTKKMSQETSMKNAQKRWFG